MTKITNLPLAAIIAGTLVALAAGPAIANPPSDAIDDFVGTLESLQAGIDDLRNLLEPKTIFVSSTDHTGDLGGLAGADLICQGLADAPESIVPEGEYVALLSTDMINASARITPTTGPFVTSVGVPVAASFAALFGTKSANTDLALISPILRDEEGVFDEFVEVWTGSGRAGRAALDHCGAWLDVNESGEFGSNGKTDSQWISDGVLACIAMRHLYCVQR